TTRVARRHVRSRQRHADAEGALNRALMELARPALDDGKRVNATLSITNSDRAVGATLSGEIARRYGNTGLPDDTVTLKFNGAAGQSFGAFLARGVSMELEGEAND